MYNSNRRALRSNSGGGGISPALFPRSVVAPPSLPATTCPPQANRRVFLLHPRRRRRRRRRQRFMSRVSLIRLSAPSPASRRKKTRFRTKTIAHSPRLYVHINLIISYFLIWFYISSVKQFRRLSTLRSFACQQPCKFILPSFRPSPSGQLLYCFETLFSRGPIRTTSRVTKLARGRWWSTAPCRRARSSCCCWRRVSRVSPRRSSAAATARWALNCSPGTRPARRPNTRCATS